MSLSRLWHSTGKNKDAHRELAEIYSSFSEGLDTADLREAKALLAARATDCLIERHYLFRPFYPD